MVVILLKIFNWILLIAGIIGVIGFILEIPMAIIFAVLYSNEKEEKKKKEKLKWGITALLLPFVLIMVSLLGIVAVNAIKAFIAN